MNRDRTERSLPFDMDEPMIWIAGPVSKPMPSTEEKPRETDLRGWTLRTLRHIRAAHSKANDG
jgi:hypothetical protein